ncbi:hypothetical protein [Mucilaginibacter sp.]
MKKFLFMLVFASMAFTSVFAQERQHSDQNTQDHRQGQNHDSRQVTVHHRHKKHHHQMNNDQMNNDHRN